MTNSEEDLFTNTDLEFFPDEPEIESKYFSFENFAENLSTMINKQKDTLFSILIHGEWGSGKTTLLNILKNKLNKIKEENTQIIFFEAWRYEKIDPVAALLQLINEQIDGEGTVDERKKKRKLTLAIKGVAFLLFDMAIRAHTNMTLEEAKKHFVDTYESIKNLRQVLEELIGEDKKIIILIDDLDRCSFRNMMEIFESLKLFLNVKGITTVVTADNDKLVLAWTHAYTGLTHGEGEEYFDKIFQLKLALPIKTDKELQEYHKDMSKLIPMDYRILFDSIDNPRRLKQILNRVFYIIRYTKIKFSIEKNRRNYFSLVIIWSIITIAYPDLAKSIIVYPKLIKDFVKVVLSLEGRGKYDGFYSMMDVYREQREFPDEFKNIRGKSREALLLLMQKKKLYLLFESICRFYKVSEVTRKEVSQEAIIDKIFEDSILEEIITESASL